jgi:hypothetical protein
VLLYFNDWWDRYPTALDWEVKVEGTDGNILIGYNVGVLITKPIPNDKKVYVKADYFDLKDEFKPKLAEIERLEREVKQLEKDKMAIKEELKEATKKEIKPYKRDIRVVTFADVVYGRVKLEIFWWMSGASGVYLGNSKINEKMEFLSPLDTNIQSATSGFILTNAHVAAAGLKREVWVSDDKETMYIVGPGYPSIRYTQHSDRFGSPAKLLSVDDSLVYSVDYDCAVYVTSPVPGYEKNKAFLGDSDKVKDGTKIVMVGNPAGFQKFSTAGIISNADYPSINAGLRKNIRNIKPTMWIDAPIGAGGTSGSGVWALEGSQAGKVISLHNSGIHTGIWVSEIKEEKNIYFDNAGVVWNEMPETADAVAYMSGKIINITKEQKDKLFESYPARDAVFDRQYSNIKDDSFIKMMEDKSYVMVRMDGMSAGIPINDVKTYLQERGIDPKIFDFNGVDNDYWVK